MLDIQVRMGGSRDATELNSLEVHLCIAASLHLRTDESSWSHPDLDIDFGIEFVDVLHARAAVMVTITNYGQDAHLDDLDTRLETIRDFVLRHTRWLETVGHQKIPQLAMHGGPGRTQEALFIRYIPCPEAACTSGSPPS